MVSFSMSGHRKVIATASVDFLLGQTYEKERKDCPIHFLGSHHIKRKRDRNLFVIPEKWMDKSFPFLLFHFPGPQPSLRSLSPTCGPRKNEREEKMCECVNEVHRYACIHTFTGDRPNNWPES